MGEDMAVLTGQVTVGTTPTQIVPPRSRNGVSFVQMSGSDVFLGDSSVTTTTGVLLTGVKGTPMNWVGNDAFYGIVASGNATVSFAENA